MLVDEVSGEPTNLEGRARGAVIELTMDHEAGTLTFRLNGGVDGPAVVGFPTVTPSGDVAAGGLLLRPVIGMRMGAALTEDDQVTIRGTGRLREGWPQQDDRVRERDLRGLVAARALTHALDAAGASNRMRLASFRIVHSPRLAASESGGASEGGT